MHDIALAVITATPPTLAAVAALLKARQAEAHVRPNGHGSVVQIAERLEKGLDDVLTWQTNHEVNHRRLNRRLESADHDLDDIHETVEQIKEQT